MNGSTENIINKFNNSILDINWFSNIGEFSEQNILKDVKNYLCSINRVATLKIISSWDDASIITNSPEFDKNLWKEEANEKKLLYLDIIKNISKEELSKYLSIITKTSYEIINNTLIEIAKKNKIRDQYFVKVAGGAAGLACHQKTLALISEAGKTHMFHTKFTLFTLGHWPLIISRDKISIF